MGESDTGHIRASDDDRSRVTDELRAHCAAGRITVEELDDRVGRAMAAVTIGELNALRADLPRLGPGPVAVAVAGDAAPPAQASGVGRGRGIQPFTLRISVPVAIERARSSAMAEVAPALTGEGFALTIQSTNGMSFECQPSKTAAIILSVLLFPIGLIAFAFVREQRVAISFEPDGPDRTAIVIHGSASRRVRRMFAEMRITPQ